MGAQSGNYVKTKKKIKRTVREETGATFMLRCAELSLSDHALELMTMGMVFDMLIERGNDQEKYVELADQDDIYRLFPR